MTIEIVDIYIYIYPLDMVIFHDYVAKYQRLLYSTLRMCHVHGVNLEERMKLSINEKNLGFESTSFGPSQGSREDYNPL